MGSRLFAVWLVLMVGLAGACSSAQGEATGSAELVATASSALSQASVASLTVMISGPSIATPIVKNLVQTGGTWGGTLGGIPVGTVTFTGNAYDSTNTLIYSGTAPGVTISSGATALVTLVLQQVTPPPAYSEQVPVIASLVASTSTPSTSSPVTLTVTASDPTPGDTLTYAWTATGGTFSSTTATTTTWTSPATNGPQTITIAVTDAHQETATLSATMQVSASNATGSGQVTVTLNTWPVVSLVTASPANLNVGQTTALVATASDADSNPLSYAWSAGCAGSFSSSTSASTQFSLAAPVPASGSCTLTITVNDGKGGTATGSVAIQTGSGASPTIAPQIVSTFQSATTIAQGGQITLSLDASDPQGGALTFAWTGAGGTLSGQTDTAGSSQVTWTDAADCGAASTIAVEVTDAAGASTTASFQVTTLCAAGNLSGIVTLGDGSALVGGTVVAVNGSASTSATTTATGAYDMAVAPGTYTLSVQYVDGAFNTGGSVVATDVVVAGNTVQNIQVPTFVFHGLIVDGSNNPVAGVTFSGYAVAQGNEAFEYVNATSDDTGRFSVRMLAGSYTNIVLSPPAGPYVKTPLPNEQFTQATTQTFVLDSAEQLSGQVTLGDGSILAGATVVASSGSAQASTTTNSTGVYSLSVAPGTYTLSVQYVDGAFNTGGSVVAKNVVVAGNTVQNIQVPTFVLNGLIVDGSNNPVAGVTFSAYAVAQGNEAFEYISATSDATGQFSVRMLAGSYSNVVLTPTPGPYVKTPLPDEQFSQATTQTFVIANASVISGQVTLGDGSILAGATVVASSGSAQASATTSSMGAYSLSVAPGTYTLSVQYVDGAFNTGGSVVATNVVVAGNTVQNIQVPTFVLNGLIVDGSNNPVAGVTFSAYAVAQGNEAFEYINATSDATGQFSVRMLAGSYTNVLLTPPPGAYVKTPLPDEQFSQATTQTFVVDQ